MIVFIQKLLSKWFPYRGYNPYDRFVTPARQGRNWDDLKQMEK